MVWGGDTNVSFKSTFPPPKGRKHFWTKLPFGQNVADPYRKIQYKAFFRSKSTFV